MSNPVYEGMPPVERVFEVPRTGTADPKDIWGHIICGGRCKDDYDRIVVKTSQNGAAYVKLQKAAAKSFLVACDDVGFFIHCTGSWRSCATQTSLYNSDPPASTQRYAPPDKTAHCRGLAIDVTTVYQSDPAKWKAIRDALEKRHWHQARPTDEPWHYSFGIQV